MISNNLMTKKNSIENGIYDIFINISLYFLIFETIIIIILYYILIIHFIFNIFNDDNK